MDGDVRGLAVLRAGREGPLTRRLDGSVVELSAVVRADGTVGEVAVTQSLDTTYGLDDAAVAAVEQWTFTPGTKDGRAVDVEIRLTIRFTLA